VRAGRKSVSGEDSVEWRKGGCGKRGRTTKPTKRTFLRYYELAVRRRVIITFASEFHRELLRVRHALPAVSPVIKTIWKWSGKYEAAKVICVQKVEAHKAHSWLCFIFDDEPSSWTADSKPVAGKGKLESAEPTMGLAEEVKASDMLVFARKSARTLSPWAVPVCTQKPCQSKNRFDHQFARVVGRNPCPGCQPHSAVVTSARRWPVKGSLKFSQVDAAGRPRPLTVAYEVCVDVLVQTDSFRQ